MVGGVYCCAIVGGCVLWVVWVVIMVGGNSVV